MIDGIDIFEPRESGLPDFTKISVGQIFNGSVAASLNSIKDPLGLLETGKGYIGTEESPWKNTTIDPRTGKRVEVRKARVVEELLNGSIPARRGQTHINQRKTRGNKSDYYAPGSPEPDLPANPNSPGDPSLLNVPAPNWHPPMAPDYNPPPPSDIQPVGDSMMPSLFPPLELSPGEQRSAALRKLPTILLDELKDLRLV